MSRNRGKPSGSPQHVRLYGLANLLATGLFIAYLTPFAKATLASAATVIAYYLVARAFLPDDITIRGAYILGAVAAISIVGVWASRAVAKQSGDEDPSKVVIDEVAGQLLAVAPLPLEAGWMVGAFLLFRMFDVLKPLGIRKLEKIGNGFGIMLDDLAAGFAAGVLLLASYVVGELIRGSDIDLLQWFASLI